MTEQERDIYDEAVDYFTAHPDEIPNAWCRPTTYPYGILFGFASKKRDVGTPDGPGSRCGCITEVATGKYNAETQEATLFIQSCRGVPRGGTQILVESLPIFRDINRELDKMLYRDVPRGKGK